MATAVRPFHLVLASLHLLARATAGELLLPHSRIINTTTTFPPPASISILSLASNAPAAAAGCPASSNPLRASPSPSAPSGCGVVPSLHLNITTDAREDATTAPATTTTPPAPPCPRSCGIHTRDATLDDTLLTPPGINAAPPTKAAAALLNALPLLAIPFLPPPLAALVALSTLATPVRGCSAIPSTSCSGLTHGTCTVYRYHPGNGTVDRAQPFAKLRTACPHPRCDGGSDTRARSTAYGRCRGRLDDPFHGYCSVRTLEVEIVPEGKAWRIMPVHLPIADPAAVAATGDDVCYVELEHMNYREGYYIRCPVRDCRRVPVLCCTEFPHDAVAAAVWERRRLTYRDTVAWYTVANGTVKPNLEGLADNDEL